MTRKDIQPERLSFEDDGIIPNNQRLRVLLYRGALKDADALDFKQRFEENGWTNSWQNGIFDYHHFHSNAHEVLGIARGWVKVRLGGANGKSVRIEKGDVVVLPAGTGHKCEARSGDLLVVGAYDAGRGWDICRGATRDKKKVRSNIMSVPDPDRDPVIGPRGAL
jgi:uncharacterized protein YjlB